MNKKIKTRFAPSPTGFLHVGGLRTALYSFLLAKKNKGKFVLRIEDTDQARLVEGATEGLIKTLDNFSIQSEEEPVMQSTRLEVYKKYIDQLINQKQAYYCFCDKERLDEVRKKQQEQKLQPMYDGHCLELSEEDIKAKLKAGEPYVVRMKIPANQTIKFKDLVKGEIEFKTETIDDQIILKSDGFPTYHLAVVVDDHEMGITHVIRGDEWISPTPKHILLYQAFGWELPEFAHLPLILNKDKSKLSKRQGDVAVEDYLAKGYLKETILNFVALLGWHPADDKLEIMSLTDLIKEFDLERVRKSGAIFDLDKLNWMNSQYVSKLSPEDLYKEVKSFDPEFISEKTEEKFTKEYILEVLKLEQDRATLLTDFKENTGYFFVEELKYKAELLAWKKSTPEEAKSSLEKLVKYLESIEDWKLESLEKNTIEWIKESDLKNGDVLWPMRVALSGKEKSPSPFEIASVLGKQKTLARLAKAIELL